MQKPHILLVEDDPIMGESLSERLALAGYLVSWCTSGRTALRELRARDFDALVCDVRLPDMDGRDLYRTLLESPQPPPPTLFITAYGTIEHAVELLKLGAVDYITKPLDLPSFMAKLRDACRGPGSPLPAHEELGISPGIRALTRKLPALARHPTTPVLISGESGVGKEVVARALHRQQPDPGPFVAVNCAAIPETLIEAELFGHERGAFTGASHARAGVFEQAYGGALFLDEIGDMPLAMQAKLLRVIQDRTITRIGAQTPTSVDLRLICATHRNLLALVENTQFREDLYYRVHVVHLHIPPLRERHEDILWLTERFLHDHAKRYPDEAKHLHDSARERLLAYPWPGNVRELKHTLERACIMVEGRLIRGSDIDLEHPTRAHGPGDGELRAYLDGQERERLVNTLEGHGWSMQGTAAALGISRKTLWQKMKKYGISKPL